MLDGWFSTIKLPLSLQAISPASAKPRLQVRVSRQHGVVVAPAEVLQCATGAAARDESAPVEVDAQEPVGFRRLEDRDWPRLSRPFAGRFERFNRSPA